MPNRSENRARAAWWTPHWWAQDARWLALAAVGLVFVAHALYGAMLPKTALTLSLLVSLMLLIGLTNGQVRRDLERVRDLPLPAAIFTLLLLLILWSLTPFAPGGPHPVWSYAEAGAGASTLDKSQTQLEFIKLAGLGATFLLGVAVGGSDARARALVHVAIAGGCAVAAWSFLDWARGDLSLGVGRQRLDGPFHAPNTSATLFGVLLVLTLGAASSTLRSVPAQVRLSVAAPYASAALLFLFCLIATASRGGFLATAAGIVAFVGLQLFVGRAKWTRTAILALAAVLICGAVILFGGDLLVDRFLADNLQEQGRQRLFGAHWETTRGAPLMGYGLGTFDVVNRLILNNGNLTELWSVRAAHSVYLGWLEQTGALGATAMFLTVLTILWLSARAAFRRTRMTAILFSLLAASLVFIVHGATDFALETYSMAAFWSLLLGAQFAASQGSRR